MNDKVAIILGSENDKKYVEDSYKYFEYFSITVETHVISAHRNPAEVTNFARNARKDGYKILIGGAGMAAHLSGALKANSILPVIGVPIETKKSPFSDSLLLKPCLHPFSLTYKPANFFDSPDLAECNITDTLSFANSSDIF